MEPENKIAAAYIRVSTDHQTELSPDSQLKEIRRYAAEHGFEVPDALVFRDEGISGKYADKRPAFIRMIAAAKQSPPPFSTVLLWKFSRFARNQEESIFYKRLLSKNGIEVKSISEPIIDGPFGSLIERIIEWFDEFYSINLSGEVRRGMTEKVMRGGAVSIPAFGYRIVDKEYVVDQKKAGIVRQIYHDFQYGKSLAQIARELNEIGVRTTRGHLWEKRTVEYILRNPVYIGKIRWNPHGKTRRCYDDPQVMITEGRHEPIVDTMCFDTVQNIFRSLQKKPSRVERESGIRYPYMLRGLVRCSDCGGALSMSAKGKGLQCIRYAKGRCSTSHYISVDKLNRMVIGALGSFFESQNIRITAKPQPLPATERRETLCALIKKEQQTYSRIKEAYEKGIYGIEELKESRQKADERIHALQEKLKKISLEKNQEQNQAVTTERSIVQALTDKTVTEEAKNALLKGFVNRIGFDRTHHTITISLFL